MELQLVNKEIQDKIIELGFNWFKFKQGWYFQKDEEEYYTNCERGISGEEKTYRKFEIPITQSLVVKWLRDVHKIKLFVHYSEANGTYKFEIRIPKIDDWKMERIGFISSFEIYEQAEEAGIIEALKLIKIND